MIVRNLTSVFVPPLKKTDKISAALRLMSEFKTSFAPVTDGNIYLGMISENELLIQQNKSARIEPLCKALPKPFINENEHIFNAMQVIADQQLDILPVLDDDEQFTGLITTGQVLKEITEILSVRNPGGIIILEVNQNDYSMSEIARIIESNDTKILSSGIKAVPDSTKMEITLKLNKMNIEPVIQTLIRYNYDIVFYFGDNEKNESMLRERYDLLMRFLET